VTVPRMRLLMRCASTSGEWTIFELSDSEKQAYVEWHTANIQDKGLQATLIDLISSLEARKIPIKYFRRPRCPAKGDDYNASSPKSFQDHFTLLHGCLYQEARDAMCS
jgi:hypothetical protein